MPQGKIQGSGGQTGCWTTSQASAGPFPWDVGVADSCSPCSCPVVSLHHNFPSASFIPGLFGGSALAGWLKPAPAVCELEALFPASLPLHPLPCCPDMGSPFLRLWQMDPSMNPSITRKAKEDVRTVPGWEPFTMPEVRRLGRPADGSL